MVKKNRRGLPPVVAVRIECARDDHGWYRSEAVTVKGNLIKAVCETKRRAASISGCISAAIALGCSVMRSD